MPATTVNISFQADFLAVIDAEAKRESRSRSELLREAVRLYVERQCRWDDVFSLGDSTARNRNLTEPDIVDEVAAFRQERGKRR